MRRITTICVVALALMSASAASESPAAVAGSAGVASAASATTRKAPRPTEAVVGQAGCVRAECHADIRNYAVLHGPVHLNACDACHQPTDVEAHTFRLTREKAELCTYCHEWDVAKMPVVHEPVKRGECLGCHDPHGGTSRLLIREESVAALCNRCHESIVRGRSVLHTPVAKGACDSCHPSHASRFPKLLDAVGPDLCLACHDDFEARMQTAKVTHKALEQGCEKCHDVHGSNHAMATTQPVREQCGGCHQPIMTAAADARYPHTPIGDGRSCMNCHTPHGSALAKLAKDAPEAVCVECHNKEVKARRGATVAAFPELAGQHAHSAFKDGGCAGCHAPHGGNSAALLTKFYSTTFYQRFSADRYALCFACHDAQLAQQPRAAGKLTSFRNGDKNLHFVHVSLQAERGENCRVCHATHAAPGERRVRDKVRFGTWEMPIRFAKTDTGGSCFPGCHPTYGYDRERPLTNKLLPTRPQTIARAGIEKPAMIELAANDQAGREIRIPDADGRPTIVMLLAAGQRESEKALALLEQVETGTTARQGEWAAAVATAAGTVGTVAATMPASQPAGAQVIVILNGAADARPLRASMDPAWSCLPDPDGELTRRLDVTGWPTALVIDRAGLEVARVGGAGESLALKLAAYVELATGRIDPAEAKRRATTRQTVGDVAVESKSALSRDLFLAEQHLAAGRIAEAKQVLQRVLAADGGSARAHVLMGRVLEQQRDWEGAAREYRAGHDAERAVLNPGNPPATTGPTGGG